MRTRGRTIGRINALNSSNYDDDNVSSATQDSIEKEQMEDMVGGMAVQHLWLSTIEEQEQKQESRRR